MNPYRARTVILVLAVASLLIGAGCSAQSAATEKGSAPLRTEVEGAARAVFGGGCFWCMEPPYDKLDGVLSTISGYAGGDVDDPTYDQVSSGRTGHTEVVEVTYDPSKVSYETLLEVFWRNIDPTVADRQFCDWGDQYRTAIFTLGEEQQRQALASKEQVLASGKVDKVLTEIEPLRTFYPAEEYHQDFYKKNPLRYYSYRRGCGRDQRLRELWGDQG